MDTQDGTGLRDGTRPATATKDTAESQSTEQTADARASTLRLRRRVGLVLALLAGGLVTALAVYVLAYQRGVRGFRLVITGIAVSAMLGSLNTWLMLRADLDVAITAAVWGRARSTRSPGRRPAPRAR